MIQRPIYRSRLFWLGLPGLVFMLWGWWISFGHFSRVGSGWPRPFLISLVSGEVSVFWEDWEQPASIGSSAFAYHREVPVQFPATWRAFLVDRREEDPTAGFVLMPYYWVVFAYVAAWLFTLAWWQRRKSRLMTRHAAP